MLLLDPNKLWVHINLAQAHSSPCDFTQKMQQNFDVEKVIVILSFSKNTPLFLVSFGSKALSHTLISIGIVINLIIQSSFSTLLRSMSITERIFNFSIKSIFSIKEFYFKHLKISSSIWSILTPQTRCANHLKQMRWARAWQHWQLAHP